MPPSPSVNDFNNSVCSVDNVLLIIEIFFLEKYENIEYKDPKRKKNDPKRTGSNWIKKITMTTKIIVELISRTRGKITADAIVFDFNMIPETTSLLFLEI